VRLTDGWRAWTSARSRRAPTEAETDDETDDATAARLGEPGPAGPGLTDTDTDTESDTDGAVDDTVGSDTEGYPQGDARAVAGSDSGAETDGSPEHAEPTEGRRSFVGGIGTIVSRVGKGRSHDLDGAEGTGGSPLAPAAHSTDPEHEPVAPYSPAASAVPLRSARPASRAQVTRDVPATTLGAAALLRQHDDDATRRTLPESRELRRPGSVDLIFEPVEDSSRVRPISRLGDPVEPLVIDDFVPEPAYDPVIGPELAAARTRLGLSVDELGERTRIRPHVIESIEVDDFAPCGGDFYARGHLRTLARVLGQDPAPLLETFEKRYSSAPINARRVFEAELATGMTGSMRSTVGGPSWGLLIGAVLVLVLAWGVVRLFETQPPELVQPPIPSLSGAGVAGDTGAGEDPAAEGPTGADVLTPAGPEVRVVLSAASSVTRVVVRDAEGSIVFAGPMTAGDQVSRQVEPPVQVRASDGSAVSVTLRGRDRGTVSEDPVAGSRTFRAPNAG
jgi:cytoskeletal protein RodZ